MAQRGWGWEGSEQEPKKVYGRSRADRLGTAAFVKKVSKCGAVRRATKFVKVLLMLHGLGVAMACTLLPRAVKQ